MEAETADTCPMRELFFAPLYPAIMAAIIVVVAVLAGVTELRLRQEPGALIPVIAFYAVPTLFIGFIATMVVYNIRQAPVEYFACRTQACRELLIAPVREMFKERLVLVELGGLALIAVAFLIRNLRPSLSASGNAKRPDPKKWHFDSNSGEYYRITGYHKGSVIFDTTPYSKRLIQDFRNTKERRGLFWTFVISGILLFFSLAFITYLYDDIHGVAAAGGYMILAVLVMAVSGIAFFVSVITLPFSLIGSAKDTVGPAPIAPRGLEDVEDQKAYGNSGPADIDAIHAALGGKASAAATSVAGPRPPLFDE